MPKENPNLIVKRARTGLGLFTLASIPKGQRIIEYVGPIITNEESIKKGGKYYFELDEKRVIDGSGRDNKARYINHSCRPNAVAYTTGKRVWIWSRRAVKPGEEITINYGKEYMDIHIEQCKCESCLKGQKK